ncbi:MAG: putative repeat protein (TIGR04138 family) [Chlamydiales bacterium]|jgi:uncharacterized repeat protein (TIGR04138 family)
MNEALRQVALSDGRYKPEAIRFLFEALDQAVQKTGAGAEADEDKRHVTGQELVDVMRIYARKIFGPIAASVWRSWGIQTTLDWGNVVFLLVDAQFLRRRESDTIDDFVEGFDFDEYFVGNYKVQALSEISPMSGPLTGPLPENDED